jgi:hypothetical protein
VNLANIKLLAMVESVLSLTATKTVFAIVRLLEYNLRLLY